MALFLMNPTCINLSGVTSLLRHGVRSGCLWEKDRAAKAPRIALDLWAVLLVVLIGLILLLRKS